MLYTKFTRAYRYMYGIHCTTGTQYTAVRTCKHNCTLLGVYLFFGISALEEEQTTTTARNVKKNNCEDHWENASLNMRDLLIAPTIFEFFWAQTGKWCDRYSIWNWAARGKLKQWKEQEAQLYCRDSARRPRHYAVQGHSQSLILFLLMDNTNWHPISHRFQLSRTDQIITFDRGCLSLTQSFPVIYLTLRSRHAISHILP